MHASHKIGWQYMYVQHDIISGGHAEVLGDAIIISAQWGLRIKHMAWEEETLITVDDFQLQVQNMGKW